MLGASLGTTGTMLAMIDVRDAADCSWLKTCFLSSLRERWCEHSIAGSYGSRTDILCIITAEVGFLALYTRFWIVHWSGIHSLKWLGVVGISSYVSSTSSSSGTEDSIVLFNKYLLFSIVGIHSTSPPPPHLPQSDCAFPIHMSSNSSQNT